ncbi:MAG: glycosyl hydrolase family 28-related protein [candidate division NC10 bacterium]
MHNLAILAAGVNGAANGTAEIFRRATSTRAQYFTDFEGDNPIDSGADVDLDANGGATIYVDQYVDVQVRDSAGNPVRFYTEGKAASTTELRSVAFTGTDYDDAETGAGKPVVLVTAMDRWLASAGAVDFLVDVGGVATNLSTAIAASLAIYFNVKDTTFGAEGNGTTDDVIPIQDAIDAASAAGGGVVFFPAGTYRITATLVVPAGVSLLGAAPNARINIDAPAAGVASIAGTGGVVTRSIVKDLQFGANQATAADLISLNTTAKVLFDNCTFNASVMTGGDCIGHVSALWLGVRDCNFRWGGNGAAIAMGAGEAHVRGCKFEPLDVGYTGTVVTMSGKSQALSGCTFDILALTGTFTCISADLLISSANYRVTGNTFIPGVGTVTYFSLNDPGSISSTSFIESGNILPLPAPDIYDVTVVAADTTLSGVVAFGSREIGGNLPNSIVSGVSPVVLNKDRLVQSVEITAAIIVSIECDLLPPGHQLIVNILNTAGAPTGTVAFDPTNFATLGGVVLADNDGYQAIFMSEVITDAGGTTRLAWVQKSELGPGAFA